MRLLLLKQDEISVLEEELEMIDNAEPRQLFLGSCRRDVNEKRKDCVARLRKALAEYGMFSTFHRVTELQVWCFSVVLMCS